MSDNIQIVSAGMTTAGTGRVEVGAPSGVSPAMVVLS